MGSAMEPTCMAVTYPIAGPTGRLLQIKVSVIGITGLYVPSQAQQCKRQEEPSHRYSRPHSPVYFLLSHLSFMDILHISNIIPQMITNFLSGTRTISFAICGFQVFLSVILLGGECLLLAAMSYDHYVAIFHPLYYAMLMSYSVSVLLVAGSWLVGTRNSIVHTAYEFHVSFCEPRVIDHYF
ncbi:Olfactory receptor 2AJ1 [Heterocephalus glaber]|uniref:Olfactory receptor 2AJ1 n=1 Tax=Heterocephalus glaber TaxID=10181 RepID=G5BDQ4_HETGA|nr:Olfactory receptor 2AJ1 [Heterocephalus glaber]